MLTAVLQAAAAKHCLARCQNTTRPLAMEQTISDQALWYVTPYSLVHISHLYSLTTIEHQIHGVSCQQAVV